MDWGSRLVAGVSFLFLVAFAGLAPVSSFGGDGNASFEAAPDCDNPIGVDNSCWNNQNDNDDNGADIDDAACVKPIGPCVPQSALDRTEGNIWDTDLAVTLAENGPEGTSSQPLSEGVMFSGKVYRGPRATGSYLVEEDSSSSTSVTEQWIDEARPERPNPDENDWAFGHDKTNILDESQFPTGTGFQDGRAIYPPNPLQGKDESEPESCGDALENEDDEQPSGSMGDESGSESTTFCTEDYGLKYEKENVVDMNGGDPDPVSCGGCGGNSGGSESGKYADGDDIVSSREHCDSSSCGCCGPSCDPCKTTYSNDDDESSYDCTQHNKVSAWRDSGEGVRNDPARTYTEFTAYDDSGWGKAWCGFEFTTTVDADGPEGQGEGFVVVENRDDQGKYSSDLADASIVATEAHNGEDDVGRRVWVDGSMESVRGKMSNDEDLMSCDLNKEVCIKYVDLYTKDSGWTTGSGGGGYEDAVGIDVVHDLTADESYSVCKNINRIARQHGSADGDLVRCDYVRESSGSPGGVERISPLNEACGDDPGERLIAQEGTEIDQSAVEEYLAFHQECYQYSSIDSAQLNSDVDASTYEGGGPDSDDSDKLEREWIEKIELGSLEYSSGKDTGDGYQDFTGSGSANISKGESKKINLTVGVDTQYPEKARVWIDYDRDGEIADENPESFDINGDVSNGDEFDKLIDIPGDAETGYTLMRVSLRYRDPPPATTESSWTRGETEDYSVRIVGESDASAGGSDEDITAGACVADGEIYPEGSVINVAAPRDNPDDRVGDGNDFTEFEAGGASHDKEVCLDIDNTTSENGGAGNLGSEVDDLLDWKYPGDRDKGGEWWDIDNWQVTQYIRNHELDSQEYREFWVENPDKNASNNPGFTGVKPEYTSEKGMALEDDCAATISDDPSDKIECEDLDGGTGRITPVFARFSEGARDDDFYRGESWLDVNLPMYHNRVQSGGNTRHIGSSGSGNTQDDEPSSLSDPSSTEHLEWDENAEIDSQDDEWAYTPDLSWGIANNGTAWPPGACYGAPREQGVDKKKEDATYANSYVSDTADVWDTGFSSGKDDGNWINPDRTDQSVRRGGVTCDLTGHDWGYAVANDSANGIECLEGDCDATGNPSSPGTEGVENSIPHEIVVERSDFAWDMDSNPGDYDQNDLQQWKSACGDDRNEYLIREHAAKQNGEYNPTFTGRDNYYACADRPTDCVLDGEVYSEGQIVDVSDVTQETGVQSEDQEICLDRNDELPGGEWWDVDNQEIRDDLIGKGIVEDPEVFVREGEIEPDKPYKIFWHGESTGSSVRDEALREARDSPYSPLGSTDFYGLGIDYWRGYALEDDCDSDLAAGCDDKGVAETRGTDGDPTSDLIYSHFRESKDGMAVKADDYSTESSWVVRMYVDGSNNHGSSTGQATENTDDVSFDSTEWGWPTSGLNDSAINESEDTWAVASETYDAVGPTGAVYDTGQCHGRSPPQHSEGWVLKNETVMANSFAKREEVNSDGRDEGNWVDPDSTERTVSRGGLTCDLNSTDWGIGYNLGSGSSLNVYEGDARTHGYEVDDRHAVSGPITFDMNSDPLGGNQDNLQQHPNACGDDKNEFLIREQRTYRGNEIDPELNERDDIYVCADRITDCAYNGRVFSEGQTADLSRFSDSDTDPEVGRNISDEEICLDLDKTTPGGEWYDKDQDLAVQNRIVGLDDTFDVSQGVNGYTDTFNFTGQVVGGSGGYIDINNRIISVDSSGRFSEEVPLIGDTQQIMEYWKNGERLARKRINLPDENYAVLNHIEISPALMYNGTQVWSNVEEFRDHDFDLNPGTDWKNQSERYERTELEYFTSQQQGVSTPPPTENDRGQFTSYYRPEGYATEDDCGPLLSQSNTGPCGDVGGGTQNYEWFSAGNFSRGGVVP